MTSSKFTAAEMAIPVHTVMPGPSGPGKSVLLQAAARRPGISCEELLKQTTPTEEQQEQETMRQEAEDRAEDQRLNAVREAFWHNTPEGHHDRSCFMICWLRLASHKNPPRSRSGRSSWRFRPTLLVLHFPGGSVIPGYVSALTRSCNKTGTPWLRLSVKAGFTDPPCRQVTGCTESITHRRQE
jgi:hypothetical protein